MNNKERLIELQREIDRIHRIQDTCNHEWGEPYYSPDKEEILEDGSYYVGVDVVIAERHTGRYREVPRWARMCKKCQKEEFTYEKEDVVVKKITRPKFK